MFTDLSAVPHHDGSATYVSDLAPDVGDAVSVFLRVPKASGVTTAMLRTYIDGEQALTETTVDRETWSVPAFMDGGLGCQLLDCSVS